jgi:hypothetical protein
MSRGRDQVSFGDESVPVNTSGPPAARPDTFYLFEDFSFANLQYRAGIHLIPTSAAE